MNRPDLARTRREQALEAASLSLTLLWAGMLLGVSFLATPVKFAAPSLSLPVALDVGQTTFHLLVRVEWGILAVYLGLTAWRNFPRGDVAGGLLIGIILALQTAWLLPALDARVALIMAGGMPAPSLLHFVYVALELLLVGILAVLSLAPLGRLAFAGRSLRLLQRNNQTERTEEDATECGCPTISSTSSSTRR